MITVLSGVNSYALNQKLAELRAQFIAKCGDGGVEICQADQIQPGGLQSLIGGATLFAPNRFVVIKNLSANKIISAQFLDAIKTVSDQVELVLVESSIDKRTALYKALKKNTELIEFGEIDESQLATWIQSEVKKYEGKIDSRTARILVRYVGLDQSRISQELTKLLAYDSHITEESIAELIDPSPQDTIFQLLEFSLSGRIGQALEVLSGLERAHEDPFQTASMLIWQTHILAIVHAAKNIPDSEVAKSAKLNPYVVRKTRGLTASISRTKLTHILDVVAECDVKLKSTSADPWRVVEHAIISMQ